MARIVLLVVVMGVVVGITLWTTGAAAQEGQTEATGGSAVKLFDHFVYSGGMLTWLVLIPLSVATIALIVEHSLSIRRAVIVPDRAVKHLRSEIESRRHAQAARYCVKNPSMLAELVHCGLTRSGEGYAAMEEAMAWATDQRATRMTRKVEYLNLIGNVSPMIGLLGTVYGMIRLFASIKESGGIPEPALIADNISIALVTTFWGLLVAIPALTMFAFFRTRIDEMTEHCASTAERLLATFKPINNTGKPGNNTSDHPAASNTAAAAQTTTVRPTNQTPDA